MPAVSKQVKALTTQFSEVKLARERANLERVNLALLQERRVLVNREDMIAYVKTCNGLVMSRLNGLPSKIAQRLAGQSTSLIAEILRAELTEILEELAYEGSRLQKEPDPDDGIQRELDLVLDDLETEADSDGGSMGRRKPLPIP